MLHSPRVGGKKDKWPAATQVTVPTICQIQGDQKVSVHLTITVQKKQAKIQHFKQFKSPTMDRAILHTVFENTVRHVDKCLVNGGRHFEHYW